MEPSKVTGEGRHILLRAHYHLMADKRYWYDIALMDASRIMCVLASDMRKCAGEPG